MSRTRDDQPRNSQTRIPFSATQQQTQVTYRDPDFFKKWYARWFNDTRDRIYRAQNAGYQFVTQEEVLGLSGQDMQSNNDLGTRVSKVVTGPVDGNPEIVAYLMKLDRKFYTEDQEAKRAKRLKMDKDIHEGRAGGAAVENAYGDVRSEIKRTA